MGLYKQCKCPDKDRCEHVWWTRFGKDNQRQTTGTSSKADARKIERERAAERDRVSREDRQRAKAEVQLDRLRTWDIERRQIMGRSSDEVEQHWRALFKVFPSTSPIAHIDDATFSGYVLARRQAGAKNQTIRRELAALVRGMTWAQKQGYIRTIPDMPVLPDDEMDEEQAGKLHPPEVVARYLEELEGEARDQAVVARYTGLRWGEMTRLRFDWVVALPSEAVPGLLRLPKGQAKAKKKGRDIPLRPEAFEVFKRRFEANPTSELVFSGEVHFKAFQAASRRAGAASTITLRDLRHIFATEVDQFGGDPLATSRLLGHGASGMTDRYLHATVTRLAAAVEKVAMDGSTVGAQVVDLGNRLTAGQRTLTPQHLLVESEIPSDSVARDVCVCLQTCPACVGGRHGGSPWVDALLMGGVL